MQKRSFQFTTEEKNEQLQTFKSDIHLLNLVMSSNTLRADVAGTYVGANVPMTIDCQQVHLHLLNGTNGNVVFQLYRTLLIQLIYATNKYTKR